MGFVDLGVLTFNVASAVNTPKFPDGADPDHRSLILAERLKDVLNSYSDRTGKAVSLDLIGIQEAIKIWRGLKEEPADFCYFLGKRLGLTNSFFAPTLDSNIQTHPDKWGEQYFKNYKRVQTGNGIISNYLFTDLPWRREKSRPTTRPTPIPDQFIPTSIRISLPGFYWSGNRDSEIRKLIVSRIELAENIGLYFLVTHLSHLTNEDRNVPTTVRSKEASQTRFEEIEAILRIVSQIREKLKQGNPIEPILLVGDFNARVESPEIVKLREFFTPLKPRWLNLKKDKVYTYPKSKLWIDYIFLSDPDGLITELDCIALNDPGLMQMSDHISVLAQLKLKTRLG